jgi:hypothetical protein
MGFWNNSSTSSLTTASSAAQTNVVMPSPEPEPETSNTSNFWNSPSNDEPDQLNTENFWSDPSQEELQEDVELLENGDFETGTLEGWETETLYDAVIVPDEIESDQVLPEPPEFPDGVYVIENGENTPLSDYPTTANPDGGDYIALTDQSGPSAHVLMQDFTVPEDGADLLILSFDLFANDWSGEAPVGFIKDLDDLNPPNQQVRVEIIEEDADLFSTDEADVVHEFDLGDVYGDEPPDQFTRFAFDDFGDELQAGETYSLRFGEAATQYWLNLGVDNVSLISNPSDDIENFWNGDQDESDPAPPENFWNGSQDDSEQAPPENFWSESEGDIFVFNLFGSVASDGGFSEADPEASGYHYISNLIPGSEYTIEAHRLEDDLDPAMWVFANHHTYEDFVESGTLTYGNFQIQDATIGYLDFADDEISFPSGPWGDPRSEVEAPESGELTVVVTNFASGSDDGGDGRFDYRVDVIGEFAENPNQTVIENFWSQAAADDQSVEMLGVALIPEGDMPMPA